MRRILFVLAAVFATAALAASAALGANPHFKKGGTPVCTFSGTTSIPTTCTASLAGLGNADVNVHLSVSGFALYQCQNGGGNTAPGQNRVLAGPATSDTAIPASAIKNGNLTFTQPGHPHRGNDGERRDGGVSEQQLDGSEPHPHTHEHHLDDRTATRDGDLHLHRVKPEWADEPGHADLLTEARIGC